MRGFKTTAAMLVLGAAIGASAAGAAPPKHANSAPAKSPVTYVFRGVVAAAPGAGATSLQVQINAGNKVAVDKLGTLAGSVAALPLAITAQYVAWSVDNKPLPGTTATMQVGDPVAVTIMGVNSSTFAQLIVTPATRVNDYVLSSKPHGRMFLFNGNAVSVDVTAHTITLDVKRTNWRAGQALTGQSATQTFAYDPATTTFVDFNAKGKARLLTPDKILAGDRVTVKVISANYDSHLSTLLKIAAWRINDHEPQSLVNSAISSTNAHTL